jgi:hypothetical protein
MASRRAASTAETASDKTNRRQLFEAALVGGLVILRIIIEV